MPEITMETLKNRNTGKSLLHFVCLIYIAIGLAYFVVLNPVSLDTIA